MKKKQKNRMNNNTDAQIDRRTDCGGWNHRASSWNWGSNSTGSLGMSCRYKKMNLMKNKKEYNHKPKIKTVLRIYLWLDYHSGLTVLNYLNPSFMKLDPSLKLFFAHFISFLESVIWLPTAISGPSSREQPYSRNVNHCIVTTFHPKVTDR